MEALEKKILKTIAQNLQNSTVMRSGEDFVNWSKRMQLTIQQSIPMFNTLLDQDINEKPSGGVTLG